MSLAPMSAPMVPTAVATSRSEVKAVIINSRLRA